METFVHKKLSDKIKTLPDFLAEELSDFIDFLKVRKIRYVSVSNG